MNRIVYALQFITIGLLCASVYMSRGTAMRLEGIDRDLARLSERVRAIEAAHIAEREARTERMIEALEREISRLEQKAPTVIQ